MPNTSPVFNSFSAPVAGTGEDTQVIITFGDLADQGDESDSDGTVTAFVVKSVTSGTLLIGTDAASATPFDASTNNTIDATHQAFWTPDADANGTLDAFTVVAQDNEGAESSTLVQAQVGVTPVNDAPSFDRETHLSFSPTSVYGTGSTPVSVTSADVNGDGNADIITANQDSNSVSVLPGNGDGTFGAQGEYAVSESGNPKSVTSGDINGDGKPDIVTANGPGDSVSVLLNQGDGTFGTQVTYTVSEGANPRSVTIADVDGDGNADIITANRDTDSVSVLPGNGDGTFGSQIESAAGSSPQSVAVADVNGDSKADIITANRGGDSVSVLLGNSDGTFALQVEYGTGDNPYSLAVGDMNGDGIVDIITPNQGSSTVSVLLGKGDGAFAPEVSYAVGGIPLGITIADVNGDGKADIVVNCVYDSNNYNASVLLGKSDGTFAGYQEFVTGNYPASITKADVNGDGQPDIVTADDGGSTVSVLVNNTPPVLVTPFTEQTPVAVSSEILLSDPDGDAEWNGGSLQVQITANAESLDTLSLPTTDPGSGGIWLDTTGNKLMAGSSEIGTTVVSSVSGGTAWTFTFNANATNALVQEVARAVTFNNTSDAPGTSDRSVTFTATDSSSVSATSVQTVTVTPVNDAPTLSAFSGQVETTNEDTQVTITFAELAAKGNEADSDGMVTAFVVTGVTSGTLLIGTDAASATPFDASTNNTIDATHQAFWTPDADANGTLDAFTVVAQDNEGAESSTLVQAQVGVTPVNDAPVINRSVDLSSFDTKTDYETGNAPYSVTVADIDDDGKADLVVANRTSGSVSVLLGKGDGIFRSSVDYAAGITPTSVTAGDVNGDGKLDLVVANNTGGGVSVLPGMGDGTFLAAEYYATGSNPSSVTAGDVNGDGDTDIIVANSGDDTVSVLFGDGEGEFGGKTDGNVGDLPYSVAVADLDGDGRDDIVAANYLSDTVSVLLSESDGTYTRIDISTGDGPISAAIGDVNGDGKLDLVVAEKNANRVSVFVGNGDGTFGTQVDYAVGSEPYSVSIGDVNGDGKADIVTANQSGQSVSVLEGNGDGTFRSKVDFGTGSVPISAVTGDFNGDSPNDIAVACNGSNSVSVLLNRQTVTDFTEQTPVEVIDDIVLSDPDGNSDWNDGSLKVQITENANSEDTLSLPTVNPGGSGIWIDTSGNLLMSGTTEIGTSNASSVSGGTAWTFTFSANATNALVQQVARAVTFSNTSDKPDTADRSVTFTATDCHGVSASTEQTVTVTAVNDAPTLTAVSGPLAAGNENKTEVITFEDLVAKGDEADVDGTVPAFVVKSVTGGTLKIGTDAASATAYDASSNNMIDGTHQAFWTPAAGANGMLDAFTIVAKDDMGAESALSVDVEVYVTPKTNPPVIRSSVTGLSFEDKLDFPTGSGLPASVTKADVNHDGKIDIITSNLNGSNVSVLLGNGAGSFGTPAIYATGSDPYQVVTADLNGDGWADIVTANYNGNSVSVMLNNGNGTFAQRQDFAVGSETNSVACADIDNDGDVDIVAANIDSSNVSVLLNNGNGSFTAQSTFLTASYPYSVTIADLNNDGKEDIVTANNSFSVSVLLGNGDGSFQAHADYGTAAQTSSVATADFNHDGNADIVVSYKNSNWVSVFAGKGDGTFTSAVNYTAGSSGYSVTTADVNGDGWADIVTANSSSNSVSVLLNNGNGTFVTKTDYVTGTSSLSALR